MTAQNEASKQNIIQRLRRIEGQARGLQDMLNKDRNCREIIQQFASVRSALQSAMVVFVKEYATQCLLNPDQDEKVSREKLVEDLVFILEKTDI